MFADKQFGPLSVFSVDIDFQFITEPTYRTIIGGIGLFPLRIFCFIIVAKLWGGVMMMMRV